MKTTAITLHGEIHITILGNTYRLTHQTRPTQTVTGEAELLAQIAANDEEEPCLRLLAKDNATIALTPDKRHGVEGWRGSRYEEIGKPAKPWDEWHLFFPTIREAIELFGKPTKETEAGIHEARLRF